MRLGGEVALDLRPALGGVGGVVDLTALMSRDVTKEEINAAMKKAAEGPLKGILMYTEDPIVSTDIQKSSYSCVFDSQLTMVSDDIVKVFGWYDNEWGYSCRLVDLVQRL